jgi:hypothetical protein
MFRPASGSSSRPYPTSQEEGIPCCHREFEVSISYELKFCGLDTTRDEMHGELQVVYKKLFEAECNATHL